MRVLPHHNNTQPINFSASDDEEFTLQLARRGKSNSVLLVALHRPAVRNAFNDAQYLDLISVLHQAALDETVSAIVLTGTGPYFSSGADLAGMSFSTDDDEDEKEGSGGKNQQEQGMLARPPGRFMMELLKFPKIICAAINGPAVGIGVTLLLHCDLCHCSEDATFWVPFTRIALVPEFCSSVTFRETMGLSNANELLLLSKKIDAKKAVRNHLCSDIIYDCDKSGDPFHNQSIGNQICSEIDERILSLPKSEKTVSLFVSMIRSNRRKRYENICKEELVKLDERYDSGEVLEAAMQLNFGKSKL